MAWRKGLENGAGLRGKKMLAPAGEGEGK